MHLSAVATIEELLKTFPTVDLEPFEYPRDRSWALSWEVMQLVGRLAQLLKPKRVIEFGSGRSTETLAAMVQPYGGRILSFDHLACYATETAQRFKNRGLSQGAHVVHTPITWRHYGAKILPTYSIHWEELKEFYPCELALVDGPPGFIGREAVLYELFARLSIGGWVVVDDMDRPDEQSWLASWIRVFGDGLGVKVLPHIGDGIALLWKCGDTSPRYRFGWQEIWRSWQHSCRMRARSLRKLLFNGSNGG